MTPIYLDYNATTPLDPAVVEAMLPYLREHFGNPSSTHTYGRIAHDAVEKARTQVAALLEAKSDEVVFTGGGTEASNHAILGAAFPALSSAHVVISAFEHPATVKPCEFLRLLGCRVTVVPVDRQGLVDPDAVKTALTEGATLVSIMHSNNEVGTLQPIREIAWLAHEAGALMHTDVAQSLGKVAVDVNDQGIDLLTVAGHKLYAPKGVGALFIRDGVKLEPLIHGAGQEGGRRAGTENVPHLVALGQACDLVRAGLPAVAGRLRQLRDRLWNQLRAGLGERVVLNGHPEQRLPNTLNASFVGHIGAELLARVPEIAASTGSACHEGRVKLSPVLSAMGILPEIGQGALRLTVGRFTTQDEVDRAAESLIGAARK